MSVCSHFLFFLAVVTLFIPETRRHKVQGVRLRPDASPIASPEALAQREFKDNAGLVSMVGKNRHYLPASGELKDEAIPVWTKRVKLRGAESLLVLPLTTGGRSPLNS